MRRSVVVEESDLFPGELVFRTDAQDGFNERYAGWVSRLAILNNLFCLDDFVDVLRNDDVDVVFSPYTVKVLSRFQLLKVPLIVDGYDLYRFQQFGLRRAMESDFYFLNWSTGAGKGYTAAAGAAMLLRADRIDVVVAATVNKSRIDLCRLFLRGNPTAVVVEGSKAKRQKTYTNCHQIYVVNYEKFHYDLDEIDALVRGRRVLWILDEVQKIVTDSRTNLARRAYNKLVRAGGDGSKVWPMSASVVNGNPLRYKDVYSLSRESSNPLGTKKDFVERYAADVYTTNLRSNSGKRFSITSYDWDYTKLQDVRHRVGDRTQAVRKTDPDIRPFFKGLTTIVENIVPSRPEHNVYDAITTAALKAFVSEKTLVPYYAMLRYAANFPGALEHVGSPEVLEILDHVDVAVVESSKLAKLNEQLASIRESGDQAVVFSHWTHLTARLIAPLIEVPVVIHDGAQTVAKSQEAKEKFQGCPDITCFLTSDAGSHGLNLQNARYVIQYEPTYSYDDGMQRASRIDRADSHLDGLTNYVYIVENSIEERIWKVNEHRRRLAEVVQGTREARSYGTSEDDDTLFEKNENDKKVLEWLIFGHRKP